MNIQEVIAQYERETGKIPDPEVVEIVKKALAVGEAVSARGREYAAEGREPLKREALLDRINGDRELVEVFGDYFMACYTNGYETAAKMQKMEVPA